MLHCDDSGGALGLCGQRLKSHLCLWLCAVTDLRSLTKGGSVFLSVGPRTRTHTHTHRFHCPARIRETRPRLHAALTAFSSHCNGSSRSVHRLVPPTHPSCIRRFLLRGRESGSGETAILPQVAPPRIGWKTCSPK